jgi:hypothetical protein
VRTEALRLTQLDGDDLRLDLQALDLQSCVSAERAVLKAIEVAAFE